MNIVDKVGFIDDLFNLVWVGYIEYSILFNFIKFLDKELNYFFWESVYNGIGYIIDMF